MIIVLFSNIAQNKNLDRHIRLLGLQKKKEEEEEKKRTKLFSTTKGQRQVFFLSLKCNGSLFMTRSLNLYLNCERFGLCNQRFNLGQFIL
jgi:hypothetical protein